MAISFLMLWGLGLQAIDNKGIVFQELSSERFTLISDGQPVSVLIDQSDDIGVRIAVTALINDFKMVSGVEPKLITEPTEKRVVIIGTLESEHIKRLIKSKKIDQKELKGKLEKYIMTTVMNPLDGVDQALVIVGSDKRGTIYGIYELSEQIGVSPWYDWADVPVEPKKNLSIAQGVYTAGEPAVTYRGIFLNDEDPCLTTWVKNTYGTNYGDHNFYARVFELILRLRGNFLWPAMWGWSFYADDDLNSQTADNMGIIMGTSHHEPMARNHQEWARKRGEFGVWDYASNQQVLDDFFREGIERSKNNDDLITIGMRGDGDAALGGQEGKDHEYESQDEYNMALLETIFKNQRQIIKEVTGKSPEKRPQVWALYKEVLKFYDLGLRVPEDVTLLLSDDNWGNVRRLPSPEERNRKGGWGMYYHVDYVGAPRNSKWLNITPIQNLWEQMQLTYDYGVDRLWVVNVGDLKPMEYPITLFLNMAWNPEKFSAATLLDHTYEFCAQQFGPDQAEQAARLLNLYSKYNGRVTPEMMDRTTYNLETGEWKQVCDDYVRLEAEALRQYITLKPQYRDAYQQLILFPIQAMSNLYDMYYSQAMNNKLFKDNNPEANNWADRVESLFLRDAQLCAAYNTEMSNGKWNGMMIQKHIGYTSWNDNFRADKLPNVYRITESDKKGGFVFSEKNGVVSIEAEHFFSAQDADGDEGKWTIIPYMGRTLSGVALMPYNKSTSGASLTYKMTLPVNVKTIDIRVIVKSTLPFKRIEGHRYAVSIDGGEEVIVNFNEKLNDEPENIYSSFYPTVARRVVESVVTFEPSSSTNGTHTLTFRPIEPGIVFQKIVVDCGGYKKSYLFMDESPFVRE